MADIVEWFFRPVTIFGTWFSGYGFFHILLLIWIAAVVFNRVGPALLTGFRADREALKFVPTLAVWAMWATALATPSVQTLVAALLEGKVNPADPVLQRAVLWLSVAAIINLAASRARTRTPGWIALVFGLLMMTYEGM